MPENNKKQSDVILTTKLNPPLIRSDILDRPQLLDRLEQHVLRPLTLISAPAGYGKSTLAAQWLQASSLRGVWISLDSGDSSLRAFLRYFVAAVRSIEANACAHVYDLINTSELPSIEILATYLANDLEEIDESFLLVLDDYHLVTNSDTQILLGRLLQHPPSSLHLVIVTRHDPSLPLVTMKSRGDVVEIRESELQFDAAETGQVLERVGEIRLDDDEITHVMDEIEGWVTGLRLFCLAVEKGKDPMAYLVRMNRGTANVQDYLMDQVLSRQAPELKEWLLKTSILDRFCASLCESVCNVSPGKKAGMAAMNGTKLMETISKVNLFGIDLDLDGEWIRYHHLFQELLSVNLQSTVDSQDILALHLRAAQWFLEKGLIEEAIKHALAANDVELAADIIEQQRVNTLNADQWPVLAGWMGRIPEETIWQRPELLLGEAWLSYYRFAIPALTRIVERLDELLVADDVRPAWLGELAMFKSYLCYWQCQSQEMLSHVATAQALLPLTHDLMRADSDIYFGLAHHMVGQKDLAIEMLNHRIQEQPNVKGLYPTRWAITLSFIHLLSGDLKQSAIYAQQLGELAWTSSPVYITSWSMYLKGCSDLHAGEWEAAERHFRWMAENRYTAHTASVVSSLFGLALALHYLGRPEDSADAATLLLNYAIETSDPSNLAIANSAKARLGLLRGQTSIPSDTAALTDAAATIVTSFIFLEVPVITRCRLLIAGNSMEGLKEALADIMSLESAAYNIHNTYQLIDILALKAVALEKLGQGDEAIVALRQTLEMAAPGEWVRPLVEVGRPMAALLTRYAKQTHGQDTQVDYLLGFFDQDLRHEVENQPEKIAMEAMDVNLTNREADVLALLCERLYDKEIAVQLSISPTTVKTHLNHIYSKLGVSSRRDAAREAKRLELV